MNLLGSHVNDEPAATGYRLDDSSTPEWIEARRTVQRMERLAVAMDSAFYIPWVNRRIGFDAILGLLPGIGDVATTTASALIVRSAMRLRVRKRTIARMLANIGVDMLIGTIPLLGDVFDVAFKANTKNVALLKRELSGLSFDETVPNDSPPTKA